MGTPIDREKMLSINIGSSRPKMIHEGKHHRETGRPFKAITDELGNTVTEHSAPGRAPGVSDRQDVTVRPKTVHMEIGVNG